MSKRMMDDYSTDSYHPSGNSFLHRRQLYRTEGQADKVTAALMPTTALPFRRTDHVGFLLFRTSSSTVWCLGQHLKQWSGRSTGILNEPVPGTDHFRPMQRRACEQDTTMVVPSAKDKHAVVACVNEPTVVHARANSSIPAFMSDSERRPRRR